MVRILSSQSQSITFLLISGQRDYTPRPLNGQHRQASAGEHMKRHNEGHCAQHSQGAYAAQRCSGGWDGHTAAEEYVRPAVADTGWNGHKK